VHYRLARERRDEIRQRAELHAEWKAAEAGKRDGIAQVKTS
jgi:hypothetical protein